MKRFAIVLLVAFFTLASRALAPGDHPCAVCGKAIIDTIYLMSDQVEDAKKEVCEQCHLLPHGCALCRLPVPADAMRLADGRYLCARDAKTAVLETDQAKEICGNARREMESLFARFLTLPETNVTLTIEDQIHMDEMLQAPGFERQCPCLIGYTRSRIVNDGRWKHSIGILGAQPASALTAVTAHEYTHAWLKENLPAGRELDRDAVEGFCELVGYKLCESLSHLKEMQSIKKNGYSRGQIDLFIEADQTYGFYTILQWMKHGEDERLIRDDLDRIRRIDIKPLPGAKPPVFTPPPPPAQTPVPDVLTLIGISRMAGGAMALINDHSFREKETALVRVGTTNTTLQCLEIRTDSVIIREQGAEVSVELKLKTAK